MNMLSKLDMILSQMKDSEINIVKSIIELKNIAEKYNNYEIIKWCKLELEGYNNVDVPYYRKFNYNFLECHLYVDSHADEILDTTREKYIVHEEKVQFSEFIISIKSILQEDINLREIFEPILKIAENKSIIMPDSLSDFFTNYNKNYGLVGHDFSVSFLVKYFCVFAYQEHRIKFNRNFLFVNKEIIKKRLIDNLKINIYSYVDSLKLQIKTEQNKINLSKSLKIIENIKNNDNELIELKKQIIVIEEELKKFSKLDNLPNSKSFNDNILSPLANMVTISTCSPIFKQLLDLLKLIKFD